MLKNLDQGDLCGHGHRKEFLRGALGDFSQIFLGGAKSGKHLFFPIETKKTISFAKIFKIQGRPRSPCPPSDAHVRGRNMVKIHHPLTALLGWGKLSSHC